MDWSLILGGLIVGSVVGFTGMGGGALMTPLLILIFKVEPLTAVSSDLVASFFMKPVGAMVHLRRGTVNFQLVKWLCIGSVPAAFAGVFVLRALGDGKDIQGFVKKTLGAALLIAATGLLAKRFVTSRVRTRSLDVRPSSALAPGGMQSIAIRPLLTIMIGAIGGLIVGMTSVGSGSFIIIGLLALYPTLKTSHLVGTDLAQAIPLVAAAALGHLFYGDFRLSLTLSLLMGAIPGVYLGARASAAASGRMIREALVLVLIASGLKMFDMPTETLFLVLSGTMVVGSLVWICVRVRHGGWASARLASWRRPLRRG